MAIDGYSINGWCYFKMKTLPIHKQVDEKKFSDK
jgi:hypothetical protein